MIKLKNLFIIFVLFFSISIAFAEDFATTSIVAAGFSGAFNATGTVTDGIGAPIQGATVFLGALGSAAPPGSEWCALPSGITNVTTTTDSNGKYSISDTGVEATGGNSCIWALIVSKPGYRTNDTNVTFVIIDFPQPERKHTYVWDRVLLKYAELTATVTTNLINDPYSNTDQIYDVTVNVTNTGDIAADSIVSNLSAIYSSILSASSIDLDTISGRSSQTATYTVQSPSFNTTDTLTANVTGIDAELLTALNAVATKDIIVQVQAGGDDAKLNVTSVALNYTTIEHGTDETIDVNATVLNDGQATALDTSVGHVIRTGNDCTGTDVTSDFTVGVPTPIYANITGGNTADFIFTINSTIAPVGNYTICITAAATDANTGGVVGSNENYATFSIVDTLPPVITITSPAGGSVTGPSALLSANTSEEANCQYFVDSGIYAAMAVTGSLVHEQPMTGLTDGVHTAYVNCTDLSGNWAEANVTWTVDAIGPTITLIAPPNGSVITIGMSIDFSINDTNNVSATWYTANSITGTTIFSGVNQTEYLTLDTTGWSEDVYTIIVWANDTLGNINDTQAQYGNITVVVNGTGPNITINNPITDTWYGNWIMLNVTATDDYAVKQVMYTWSNATDSGSGMLSLTAGTPKDGTWTYNFSTLSLLESAYNFTFTAFDAVMNDDTKTVENVLIDHTGPIVNITLPASMDNLLIKSKFNISADVSDALSGIANDAICNVYVENKYIGNISYDNTTGKCAGRIMLAHVSAPGIIQLTVVAFDKVGNAGNSSVDVNVTSTYGGGGGGGGGLGGGTTNETPDELLMTIDVEPNNVDMLSNESAKLIVTIKNIGKAKIQSLYPDISIFDSDEWSIVPPGRVNVDPGQEATLEITITPKTHNTGTFTAIITIGNSRVEESEPVDFTITNVADLELAANARATCDKARAYIVNLSASGIDTKDIAKDMDKADKAVGKSDFKTALDTCTSILAFIPSGGAGTGANGGITGMFIGIGDFVVGNWLWIAIASIIGLSLFVGRKQIKGGLGKIKGFKIKPPKMPSMPNLFAKKTDVKKDEPEFEIGY